MAKLFLLFSALSVAAALDLKVTGMSCEDLPITADLSLMCNGSDRCTFGEQAEIVGTLYYNGVENSGIQDNTAYISANMDFFVTSYDLFDMREVLLCDSIYQEEGNQYDCPGDGAYDFSMTYALPDSASGVMSWLATGWSGEADVTFYAEQDVAGMVIGHCTLNLQTYVTPDEEKGLMQTPSAAATAGIVLALVVLSLFCCAYCYCTSCCRRKDRNTHTGVNRGHDGLTASFKQMDDSPSVDPAGKYAAPRTPKVENPSLV